MPTPTIPAGNLFMNATLYTGNGSTQTITNGVAGQSFQPDYVWIKGRSGATDHVLTDSVRGATKELKSNTTAAESTAVNGLTAFNSNGFSVGTAADYNTNAATYVAWNWKAGGAAVTNTAGTISSQVSANTTSGFSVVTYTGTGSAATVGHGLGVTPSMILLKCRTVGHDWRAFHGSFTSGDSYLRLNTTAATASSSTIWNGTLPTSSVFSVGTDGGTNQSSQTFVAYCFSQIAGYSAFGSYTGNGSADGPFVYTGFRPRFVMIKRTNAAEDWNIWDSSRSPFNLASVMLRPNNSDADDGTVPGIDLLSNGFKWRNTWSGTNASGSTYIYACWAENPFKYANAR